MANQLNSGSLDTLKSGQTLLQSIRKVDNGKYQLTLIERVSTSSNDVVVGDEEMIDGLAELNYGDDRFSNTSDYYAWPTVSAEGINRILGGGFDVNAQEFETYTTKSGAVAERVMTNVLNPVSESDGSTSGKRMRVRLMESTTPTEWQSKNGGYKINPQTNEPLKTKDGKFIYRNNRCVFTNGHVPHTKVQHDVAEVKVEEFESEDALTMM
jgi:hypothetical protein|tara:strand:+ start:527 stop:1159 length:633 start_codon:yes stop_codon:yes gene_type:complete